MLRVALLNWKNKNYDRDFSKILEAIAGPGVISWFDIVEGMLQPGKWFIEVTRVDLDTFYCYVENTTEVAVDVTGTKKVWLEVKQANIDDGTLNSPDGSWIVELKTGASYPADNFLKIASVTSGTVTDEREYLSISESKIPFTKWIKDLSDVYNFTDPTVKKFIVFDPITGKINIWDVDSTDVPMPNSLVEASQYMLWEAITSLDNACVFPETWPTFADAIVVSPIWYDSSNKRFELPFVGNGVWFTTLKLSLKKFVSPSADLWFQIQTDSAGSPDWTAITNGTTTFATSSLTTNLVDTTITFPWTVTPTAWTRYWLVIYPWTYGSETTNTTNYFGIWTFNEDTTTRWTKLWNGSAHSAVQTTVRPYLSCAWADNTLLSLTDADFWYKLGLCGIATALSAVWTKPQLSLIVKWSIHSNLSWLTTWNNCYLSNTPWGISSTAWTYAIKFGEVISTSKISLWIMGNLPSVANVWLAAWTRYIYIPIWIAKKIHLAYWLSTYAASWDSYSDRACVGQWCGIRENKAGAVRYIKMYGSYWWNGHNAELLVQIWHIM